MSRLFNPSAAVLLMESMRKGLVASWHKKSRYCFAQNPKRSLTLTSMCDSAIGKSWRITEKAPFPQPSNRASFLERILEQVRLTGFTDEEIASIAVVLKPVLEKEE